MTLRGDVHPGRLGIWLGAFTLLGPAGIAVAG